MNVIIPLILLQVSIESSGQAISTSPGKLDTIPHQELYQKLVYLLDTSEGKNISKALLYAGKKQLVVQQDWHRHYRIIGYEHPDTNSRKMILFTNPDLVNPKSNEYLLGEWNGTSDLAFEDCRFEFDGIQGEFVKIQIKVEGIPTHTFFFENKWVKLIP